MALRTLPELLDDLQYEAGDDGIEVCLSQAAPVPPSERGPVTQEYEQRYARAERAVSQERGPAVFAGVPDDVDYPVWHRGARLSYWENAAGIVYVALCQEPSAVRLVAGARPHATERDTVTMMPPND